MKSLRVAAVLLCCSVLPALAADLPPALQPLIAQGGVVGESFPGPDGLTGWVMKISGRNLIVYTTPTGNYVMSGALLDKTGTNLTKTYGEKYLPKPDAAKLAAALAADGTLVEEGVPQAPLLYAYADPNCIFCNKLWNELRPYLQSGKVRVRWVMLGFLKQTSKGRAAAIIAAKDRAGALSLDETQFDKQHEEGAIPPLDPIPSDIAKVLTLHETQMNDADGRGTPMLLFRRDGQWALNYGMPKDLPAFMATLDPQK
jgi:thiol:disulfide interchange protein DsbG